MKAGRGDISIIESTIHTSGLARTRLDFPCNCPSLNTIEQEVLLLLADDYRPTCSCSMINPGSLTMGFAEADPRQLAPSVGTTQVGITISAVPSSENRDSRARTKSGPLEEFKLTANISITPPRSPGPQLNQAQHLNDCPIHRGRRRTR